MRAENRVVCFGRFKGQRFGDLPGSYLSFLSRYLEHSPWAKWAQTVMNSRDRLGLHGGDQLQRVAAPSPAGSERDRMQRIRREKKYSVILRRCCSARALSTGEWMHARIVKRGLSDSVFLGNLLMKLYGKCGRVEEAKRVFDELRRKRNAFSWILLLAAYAENGQLQKSRSTFYQMPRRNVVAWTGIISVHAQTGSYKEAGALFRRMLLEGMTPGIHAFISALVACSCLKNLAEGQQLHSRIRECGLHRDQRIRNSLILMYGCCGKPELAREVYDEIYYFVERFDRLTLTLLLAVYSENSCYSRAINMFRRMGARTPYPIAYVIVLEACWRLPDIHYAKSLHSKMPKMFRALETIGSSLISLYDKAGDLKQAKACFARIRKRGSLAWSSIFGAYRNQHSVEILELLRSMILEGASPSQMIFSVVVSACSRDDLLGECRQQMLAMAEDHKLEPGFQNYNDMLRILTRRNEQDWAEELLETMPFKPLWSNFSDLKMQTETGEPRGGPEPQPPKVLEDVYGILRQKLLPGEIEVDQWLETDVSCLDFNPFRHPGKLEDVTKPWRVVSDMPDTMISTSFSNKQRREPGGCFP